MRIPFRRKALTATPEVVEAVQDRRANFYIRLGGTNQQVNAAFLRGQAATYGWLYANRPAVRTVVDFIARNVAQLGLKLYERIDDNERERREDHPAAQTMAWPEENTPGDEFIFRLVADYLVYDNAYVLKLRPQAGDTFTLIRLPPASVTVAGGRFTADLYRVWRRDGSHFDVNPADILHWHGYNPEDPLLGVSKLETLRQTLTEDQVSQTTTVELMRSGLKGGHIERPLEAPEWSQEAAERFRVSWKGQKTRLGEDPVLEEGMKYVRDSMTPKDAELLAGRKFTVEEVARIYGVPAGVLGLDPSTQIDEQRRQVYADVLPPITKSLACQLDADILRAEYDEEDFYFEFDLNEKLRGDLENRFPAMTSAAGRPWMTVNEVRAKENLPALQGPEGDALTIPLNVMLEGQGSPALPAPNVMPSQDPNKPPQDGSYREQPKQLTNGKALAITTVPRREADMARQRRYIDEAKALLERYYARQRRALTKKNAQKFDSGRWNRELSDDIHRLVSQIVEREGGVYAARLGAHDFDSRQVANYLRAMAAGTAEGLNRITEQDLEDMSPTEALDRATGERAAVAGASIGTRTTVFARQEAAKQAPGPEVRTKTWIADTERHAELDGVSVPLDGDWGGIEPGSEPNCACSMSIS